MINDPQVCQSGLGVVIDFHLHHTNHFQLVVNDINDNNKTCVALRLSNKSLEGERWGGRGEWWITGGEDEAVSVMT